MVKDDHGSRVGDADLRCSVGRPESACAGAASVGRWLCARLAPVAAVLLLGAHLVLAAAPAGDWWDTSYARRQKITLTDSGTGMPAGTVVSFTLDHATLVSGGKSLANGNDVRIAYWDGVNWTELSRALAAGSSWNNAATQILFKTSATMAASGTNDNYYLYFGNSSANAPAISVPTARWYKTEQLVEQSTASAAFVDVPGTTLTFAPGDASETWLVFVSGVVRSSNTAATSVEMRLLINGVEVDYWGHRTNNATTPNAAGFLIPHRITGTAAAQTIQPQFRAAAGTSYANTIRVVAALVPPGADLQLAGNDAIQQLTGTNLSITSVTFTPPGAGDYLILGKVSHHETPSSSTVQSWVEDDAGTLHPDAPAGTHYSESYAPWAPATTVFRRTLPASSRTFTLRGTSSGPGTGASEWRYARLIALRMDAWEAAEYSESPAQSTTTLATFQTKTSLTTAVPPAARDYLVIQAQRMSGNSTSTTSSKSGELRDGGVAILRTDHRIGVNGSATTGYHHTAGVANVKRTAASVTYDNGYLSPNAITVQCADSSISSLRYKDAASALGADEPVPTATWTTASQSAAESAGSITVTAQLSAVSAHNVTVPFTVGGTASNPSDFTITASPLTIPAGSTTASLTINIVDDLVDEPDETVIVTMGNPTGAVKGATTVHTATILDNDVAGVIVTESGGSTDVAEGGATDTYTIVLNSQPTADVVIAVTPDAQSNVGAGPGTARQLTFTSGNWSTPQTVTVAATDDPDIEGPHTSTITHTATSADTYYNGIAIPSVTAHITDNDTAGVIITESGGSTDVTEGGATDTYTVILHSRPTADVTVTVTPDGQSSVGAGPGVARQLTFTYGNWNVPQTVTVTALDDPDIEGPHTSTITHTVTSADGNYNGIAAASVTAHITDNDTAGVVITESGGSTDVTEGGATDTYTVVLHSRPTADVVVTITPDARSDVGAGSGVARQLTFTHANWNVPQIVTVTAVDDAVAEGLHTSTITHTAASADANYNGIAIAGVTVHITDNDIAYANFSLAAQSAMEDAGSMTVDVTLSMVSDKDVTVPFTLGGTAATPANYTITPSPVVIPAGQLSATITITIIDDFINNPDRTVILTMGNPINATKGTVTVHTATILDNEPPGVAINESGGSTVVTEGGATDSYTLVLQSQPLADVTIAISTDGKTTVNPTSVTFTAGNWNVPKTITVTSVDDAVAEGVHFSVISHTLTSADADYNGMAISNITATITDNDTAGVTVTESGGSTNVTEGGATDTYSIVLHSQPIADVTVSIATDGKTTVSPTALTFTAANWNTPQVVTVTAVDDAVAEGPHTSTISHTAASADPNYQGIAIASVTANITDNDIAGVMVTESGGSTNVTEGGATDTYSIVLHSQPVADVTVSIATDGKTTVNPVTLTFTAVNWNTPQAVTVTAVDDAVAEGLRTSSITHTATSPDPNYNGIAIASVTVNITDNDTAGVTITESSGSTNVTEGGATDTYTIALHSQPTADVTINVSTDGKTTVNPTSLTFTAGNWNVPQTVTVTAVDDVVAEGLHTSTISHTAASADPNYQGIAIASVTANITDNDTAGVTVTESGGSTNVTEGGATDTYTIVLNSQPTANVVVTVTPDAKVSVGGGSGVARQLTFTPANWNTARTVTVVAADDDVAEGLHTSTITHTAASADPNYSGIVIVSVTVSITDNDTAGVVVTESGGSTNITEGGATDTYTIALHSQPTANVTVSIATDGKTTINPATLTFTAGNWNVPQTVTVTAVDDVVAEGLHTSTITHTAASADPNYNGIAVASVTANITDNDTAGVTVTESGGSTNVTEGGATDTYTIALHSQPTADVTISISTDGKTTVNPTSLTFTAANWSVPQTVTVTAVDDAVAEGPHTSGITHTATSADPNYNGIAVASVTANITDNDIAGVTITESGGSTNVTEGGATDTYTIALHSQPTADVTISVSTDGKTTANPTSLTFTAGNWNTPQTVTVTAVDDPDVEGPHTSTITHGATSADANYNGIAVANVTVYITDNDTAGVVITESGGSTDVTEGGATDTYTLVLHSRPTADVVVTVAPDVKSDVGAGGGVARQLTFTHANWNVPQIVTVTAVDDAVAEGLHTSTITHTAASADANYNGIAIASVTVHITDNDIAYVNFSLAAQSAMEDAGSMAVDVTLSMVSDKDVTVPFTLGGTAATPANYTITPSPVVIPAGQLSTTITITIIDDFINNPDRTVILTMGNPINATKGTVTVHTATILDNEPPGVTVSESGGSTTVTEGGATDSYTLILQSQPLADVVIAITTDGNTTVNPASVTFTAGNWNVPQTITVAAVDDAVAEGVHLSVIGHTATSADADYNGIGIGNVTATITDNDAAGVTVTESGGSTNVTEGGATDTYSVVLRSQPVANVTITITTDGKTTASPAVLTFTAANWNTPQVVTVTAVDDAIAEGLHTSSITHTATSGDPNYDGLSVPGVTANITDNDGASVVVTESGGSTNVTEGGATDTYTVVLHSQPTADVTVSIATDGKTTVNPATLTFAAGNWNVPQTVTVTAVDDAVAEGLHTSTIAHTAASADPNYNGVGIASVIANITDNDIAYVNFSLAAQSAMEDAGSMTVDVTLSMVSDKDVTVPFTLGGTAATPANYTITPSPVVIPAGQLSTTITITIVDDLVHNPDRTVILTMGNPTNGTKGAVTVHTATILDNEPPGVTINESGGSTVVTEGGATDSYTLVLRSQPLADVVIAPTTDGKTTVNPASVTFTAGNWNVPQTITVTAVDDAVAQGTHSSVISHVVTSADSVYDGLAVSSVTATVIDNDTAGVTVTESGGSTNVTEGGSTDTYSVVLRSQPTADVMIAINTDGKTTVSPTALTFTAANWNAPQVVTVTGVDDAVAEGPHTSTITHTATSADPTYNGIAVASVTANITDNDTVGVMVTESGGSTNVTEGGATDTYSIVLHSQPVADVTVSIATDGKTTVNPVTLTFTAVNWSAPQVVTVAAVDDAVAEGLHTSIITHTAASADPNYSGIAIAGVTVHITDNDIAYVNFSLAAQSAMEDAGSMTVDVTLSMVGDKDVTVPFTLGGTAATPANYTITPSPVVIPAGQLSTTITITIIDDFINNPDRTVILTMGNPSNATKGTITVHTATILDNEPPGVAINESGGSTVVTEGGATDSYTLVLQSQPLADVTIAISTDGKTTVNPTSVTFTAGNWNVPKTITVTAVDDAVAEGVHFSVISHTLTSADADYNGMAISNITATITDNDTAGVTVIESGGSTNVTEGGATDTYSVVLRSQPVANVTITIATDGKTTANPAALTFNSGNWNTPQMVTVRAVDDTLAEGPHVSSITHTATSADPNYNGIAVASVTANITDNDVPGITVTPTSGLVTTKQGGTATFTIVLNSQPTADVTIGLGSSNLAEGTVSPASVTFTASNWSAPQTVTVRGVDDLVRDGNVAYTIVTAPAVSTDPNYSGMDPADVSATNMDNDTVGITVSPAAGLVIDQPGGTASFSVVLNSTPAADVTIGLSLSDPAEGTLSVPSVTFTPANWNVPQTVTVTRLDEQAVEGSASFSIVMAPAVSDDPLYNGAAAPQMPVTNDRSSDDVTVEIHRLTRYGVCGPIGYIPLLMGFPGLLGWKMQRRGRLSATSPRRKSAGR